MAQSPTVDELKQITVWLEAGLSAAQIGAELKRSRGSIIGIVDRHLKPLGITFVPRPAPVEPLHPVHSRDRVRRSLMARDNGKVVIGRLFRPTAKRLLELKSDDCRFPVREIPGLAGRYLFCASPALAGRQYCAEHWKICNTGQPSSRGGKARRT